MQDMLHTSPELDYYRRQQYQPGWQDLLDIIISGITDNAGDDDRRLFLNLMGGNLAQRFPMAPAKTVGDLEDQFNRLWFDFNWGQVRLQPRDNAIVIIHSYFPSAASGAAQAQWNAGLAAILEGAYAQWLLAQGGQSHVALRWQQDSAEGIMTFQYQNNK